MVVGRARFDNGPSRVYACVHNQVPSDAERLDQLVRAIGIDPNTRITILSDGAGEFDKAAKGCTQPMCRVLEWFHIAMKFQATQTSVFGAKIVGPMEGETIKREILSAKWLV